jgi:Response receiver domain
MTTKARVANDLAVEIVSDFLQSVVIVDDGADYNPSAYRGVAELGAPEAHEVIKSTRFPKPRLKAPVRVKTGNANVLDAKRVVDAFAERGIVCSILRPAEDEDPSGRTQKVTRRADILVLDWNFYRDNGEIARRLLRDVLGDDVRDNRRRLIAIYTAEPDLDDILRRVREVLLLPKGRMVRSGGPYTLDAGIARVVVLAKPESRIPIEKRRVRKQIVAYDDLAGVLIDQFSTFMYGLVSNVALKSVAALRSNTHQLLKKLGPELDAGYLWHRAVQMYPKDAEQQLVDLVSAELRAILDDCDVREAASSRAIRQWLEKLREPDFGKRFGEPQQRSIDDVMELLEFGSAAKSTHTEKVLLKFPKMKAKTAHRNRDEIAAFAASKVAAARSNEAFAVLASHRTQYSKPEPHLTLGTIISAGTGKKRRYWLCLQPVCDTVRLINALRFPFLELHAADSGGFQFVLQSRGRTTVRLRIEVTPQNLTMLEFHPTSGKDCVVADVRNRGFFFSRGKRRYRWEAELKREHAQRFAEKLANEFSRIGLVESEWLRLWGREPVPPSVAEKGG